MPTAWWCRNSYLKQWTGCLCWKEAVQVVYIKRKINWESMHKTYFQFLPSLFSVPMLASKFSPHFLIFLPVKWTHQNEGTVIIVLVEIAWLSFNRILYTSWVALYSVVCWASVSPDQISTFSNIYRHKSPILTLYQLIPSSTNLYWPSTSHYRHELTQYH